jgi:GH15 family glucan-1,4-alpha-glucosidase
MSQLSGIEDYALLGDLHTAALVSGDGSVDWLCLPRFDSPACFAALLHDETAGRWRIAPTSGGVGIRRRYRGDTLVLETEWDLPGPVDRWRALRARIRAEVSMKGYDPDRNTFTQFSGSNGVDSALLLLPRVGFLPWRDARMRGTVAAIRRELCENDLVLRHRTDGGVDGLPGTESAFAACGFWLADALHGTGHHHEVRELFEKLLDLRNDVGLLSEQHEPVTGRHLGNTPRTTCMVALIDTAHQLSGPAPRPLVAHMSTWAEPTGRTTARRGPAAR